MSILFRKDGIWEQDGPPKQILTVLRYPVTVEENVTLLDVFNAVEKYPELLEFIKQYSWCNHILDFHKQAREPYNKIKDKEPLDYLLVKWRASYNKKKIFHLHTNFLGKKNNNNENYSVSYSPMYELAHLPIKVNPNFQIRLNGKILLEGIQEFTLIEFLDAIYDDISFMGGPEDNADFIQEMKSKINDIKENLY